MKFIFQIFSQTVLVSFFAVTAIGVPTQQSTNLLATPALHLLYKGQIFSLSYFGENVTNETCAPLPEELYDALNAWAFNASYAKTLSQFDRYKIMARLATVDNRGEKMVNGGPCASFPFFGSWTDYKWAHHAGQAFYGLSDTLGSDPALSDSLVKPLLRSGLARKDPTMILEFKESTKLSTSKKFKLVRIFNNAELKLSKEKSLLVVPLTLDEAAKQNPAYEMERRKTLEEFQLLQN